MDYITCDVLNDAFKTDLLGAWEINTNMRCIEIHYFIGISGVSNTNINMRCIMEKMLHLGWHD